ncbi:TnsD family Tn7-like transposition protein [Paenibacillus pasadenensis]|uniref:TnsD family Tn7-like transposition protein n=1 Tax=Paenibacillus pasadenensis TaxID=217090 RepID=UPI00041AE4C1|nr:TnsD family Tn7-like transposition protein [Paenibacillus pasadenensis]
MIFFPSLFEDELFYSAQARYHWFTGNENPRVSMKEMFGSHNICATLLFPSHLSDFCGHLPVPNTYTSDELIENHSFLPYFSPFIPEERTVKLIDSMKKRNGTSIYMMLGLAASEIRRDPFLKFCPKCAEEDEERHGEAYWHRSHQAYRVSVCYKHECSLIDSDIEVDQRHKHEMFTLSNFHRRGGCKFETVESRHAEKELFISQQSYQLLNTNFGSLGINQIRDYYVFKLQEKGLATESGRIRWLEFLPLFNQYYGQEFLSNLSSYVHPSDEDTWLHKLLRSPRVTCHPLRHILFLGFVNESVSSLNAAMNNKFDRKQQMRKILPDKKLVSKKAIMSHRVNWLRRDMEIAEEVRKVASDIAKTETKLVRITKTEVGRRLRIQPLLNRAYFNLPKTKEVMNEVIESSEQYQIRRIKWAVKQLSKQKLNVQVWEVNRAAGIKQKFEKKYRLLIEQEIQLQMVSNKETSL